MSDGTKDNKRGEDDAFGRVDIPGGMTGAERFSPDYDDPVPNRSHFPFNFLFYAYCFRLRKYC